MGAGAIAIAVGPLIGGIATTYFSWRWVFVGEVRGRGRDPAAGPPDRRRSAGGQGPASTWSARCWSAVGLGLAVFGVLRSSDWGWVTPKPDGPSWLGMSPTIWLILVGLLVVWLFCEWESRMQDAAAGNRWCDGRLFGNRQMSGGLLMFFLLYLVQAGLFFTIPLFLSVSLGLSALDTGLRILPLSVTLLAAAVGIPRFFPAPRRAGWCGSGCWRCSWVWSCPARRRWTPRADARIVTVPLLLAGLGIGALASQLGAVTVSAVPDELQPRGGWSAEHRHQPRRGASAPRWPARC